MTHFSLRPIQIEDNDPLKCLIIQIVKDFKVNQSEYLANTEELSHLFEQFNHPGSCYWVIINSKTQQLVGGGGIKPLIGSSKSEPIAELQKLYLHPAIRKQGLGQAVVSRLETFAQHWGYQKIYLECVEEMKAAIAFYTKLGYQTIPQRLGNTGHQSCQHFMIKTLS